MFAYKQIRNANDGWMDEMDGPKRPGLAWRPKICQLAGERTGELIEKYLGHGEVKR